MGTAVKLENTYLAIMSRHVSVSSRWRFFKLSSAWAIEFSSADPKLALVREVWILLRTTCSDTLMLRHRKASAAELSLNSFTGGELFKPCLGGLAILKLPGEEGRPKPQRAQLPAGRTSHWRDEEERSQATGSGWRARG